MAVAEVRTGSVRVTVFLSSKGFLGMRVYPFGAPEASVFLRRCQVKVIKQAGFHATLEMARDLAIKKKLI